MIQKFGNEFGINNLKKKNSFESVHKCATDANELGIG